MKTNLLCWLLGHKFIIERQEYDKKTKIMWTRSYLSNHCSRCGLTKKECKK